MLYALQSQNKSYFDKSLNMFIGVSTPAKIDNMASPILRYMMTQEMYNMIITWSRLVKWHRVPDLLLFNQVLCFVLPDVCMYSINLPFANTDVESDDPEKFQVLMGHVPGGVSLKNLAQFA